VAMATVEWFQRVLAEPGERVSPSVDLSAASRMRGVSMPHWAHS
jgi:hypothetical protein